MRSKNARTARRRTLRCTISRRQNRSCPHWTPRVGGNDRSRAGCSILRGPPPTCVIRFSASAPRLPRVPCPRKQLSRTRSSARSVAAVPDLSGDRISDGPLHRWMCLVRRCSRAESPRRARGERDGQQTSTRRFLSSPRLRFHSSEAALRYPGTLPARTVHWSDLAGALATGMGRVCPAHLR